MIRDINNWSLSFRQCFLKIKETSIILSSLFYIICLRIFKISLTDFATQYFKHVFNRLVKCRKVRSKNNSCINMSKIRLHQEQSKTTLCQNFWNFLILSGWGGGKGSEKVHRTKIVSGSHYPSPSELNWYPCLWRSATVGFPSKILGERYDETKVAFFTFCIAFYLRNESSFLKLIKNLLNKFKRCEG